MSSAERVALVLLLAAICTVLGAAALVLLRIARDGATLRRRLGLAPAVGAVIAGILVATASVAGVVVGPLALGVVATAAGAVAVAVIGPAALRPVRPTILGAAVATAAAGAVALLAWRLAAAPVASFDGSLMWAYKIHALLLYGTPHADALHQSVAPGVHTEYPLLYPALQVTLLRLDGGFDEPLLRVGALSLHVMLALAAFTLLRERVRATIAGAAVAAVACAPFVIGSLGDLYVDVIVAWLGALAVLAVARWLEEDDRSLLVLGTVFAAGAILTKNEGLLGVLALGLGATVGAWRLGRGRELALAGIVVACAYAPWRVFRAASGMHDADFDLARLLHPDELARRAGRAPGTLATIGERVVLGWPVVVAVAIVAVILAAAAGRRRLVRFGITWAAALITGLTLSYLLTILVPGARLTANAERTTLQLVFGLALLAALALQRGQAPLEYRRNRRPG